MTEEEKQKQRDTERMVQEIKQKNDEQRRLKREAKTAESGNATANASGGGEDEEFEGFD